MSDTSGTLSVVVSSGARRASPALHLGLHADRPTSPPARWSLEGVDEVLLGRAEERRVGRRAAAGVVAIELGLPDGRMSTRHARLSRALGRWTLEDLGSKNGTLVDGARVTRRPLEDGDVIEVGHTFLVFRAAGGEADDLDGWPPAAAPGLATTSPALARSFDALARAARADVAIAVTGETGTGKELLGRAVHALSGRRGDFVAVNCGALPATMVEAELFGHRRGAFTGATEDRPGLIRSAAGGTLFLDEIGELAPAAQTSLLRALEEHEVTPIGGDRPVPVDLRVVTATHRDLRAEVDAGRFRGDLMARLLGASIELPPLRERREDLGLLVAALLGDRKTSLAVDAARALYRHAWPFNIRELERTLAAACAMVDGDDRIELAHLPEWAMAPRPRALQTADALLRETLVEALDRHAGNLSGVARELGKDRTQIRRWMKRLGVTRDDDEM
jgi:DNA-binding NtrC family response regulator